MLVHCVCSAVLNHAPPRVDWLMRPLQVRKAGANHGPSRGQTGPRAFTSRYLARKVHRQAGEPAVRSVRRLESRTGSR